MMPRKCTKKADERSIRPQGPQKIQTLLQLQIYPDTLGLHRFGDRSLAVRDLIEAGQQDLELRRPGGLTQSHSPEPVGFLKAGNEFFGKLFILKATAVERQRPFHHDDDGNDA